MRITVHVTPRARRAGIEALPAGGYRVAVTAPPHEGQANDAVITVVANHFGVNRSRVRIVGGRRSRRKIVDIS